MTSFVFLDYLSLLLLYLNMKALHHINKCFKFLGLSERKKIVQHSIMNRSKIGQSYD